MPAPLNRCASPLSPVKTVIESISSRPFNRPVCPDLAVNGATVLVLIVKFILNIFLEITKALLNLAGDLLDISFYLHALIIQ